MPRKCEKPKNNSVHAATLDANTPDNSTLQPPQIDGVECLDDIGQRFYAEAYRADPSRFTTADLSMLVEAAHTFQMMTANRKVLAMGQPLVVTLNNGMLARNPLLTAQQELTRSFQTLCRDLSIRSKDGAKTAKKPAAPAAPAIASDDGNVTDFAAYLDG